MLTQINAVRQRNEELKIHGDGASIFYETIADEDGSHLNISENTDIQDQVASNVKDDGAN